MAGNGLHIHSRLLKDGANVLMEKGKLSDSARKMIGGYLHLAPSLTSFGNIIPTSYFRLVPDQEAPTRICWGDRNRSTLIRVPLGWVGEVNMAKVANPKEPGSEMKDGQRQTVEYRGADGSADVYLLMAGLAVAARYGLEWNDSLKYTEKTYVDVNIYKEKNHKRADKLLRLPASCWESAEALQSQKSIYTDYGVFSEGMISSIIRHLKSFDDKNLRSEIADNEEEIQKLVEKYFNCG